jgi:hypothetical protein
MDSEMLTERRETIFVKSLFVEMMELWALARQPAHRIPEAIVASRQREYFRWRLKEGLESLWFDSEPLREVLEEILLIADGTDPIVNWAPPTLKETLSRINEPLHP